MISIPNSVFHHFNSPTSMASIISNQINSGFYDIFNPYIKDSVVVDCGANVGLFSLHAASLGAKKVVSVEPTEDHVYVLFELLKHNNVSSIIVEQAALFSSNTNLNFYVNVNNSTMNSLVQYGQGSQLKYSVPALTLKSIIDKHSIDEIGFLKVDIEGSEQYLFDSPKFFNELNKAKSFFIEVHDTVGIGNLDNLKRIQLEWKAKIENECPNFKEVNLLGPDGVYGVR